MSKKARSTSKFPQRKVAMGTLAGAIVAVSIHLLQTYTDFQSSPEFASGLTVIISTILGYVTPPKSGEVIEEDEA